VVLNLTSFSSYEIDFVPDAAQSGVSIVVLQNGTDDDKSLATETETASLVGMPDPIVNASVNSSRVKT